jgi:hypothetical protein
MLDCEREISFLGWNMAGLAAERGTRTFGTNLGHWVGGGGGHSRFYAMMRLLRMMGQRNWSCGASVVVASGQRAGFVRGCGLGYSSLVFSAGSWRRNSAAATAGIQPPAFNVCPHKARECSASQPSAMGPRGSRDNSSLCTSIILVLGLSQVGVSGRKLARARKLLLISNIVCIDRNVYFERRLLLNPGGGGGG